MVPEDMKELMVEQTGMMSGMIEVRLLILILVIITFKVEQLKEQRAWEEVQQLGKALIGMFPKPAVLLCSRWFRK